MCVCVRTEALGGDKQSFSSDLTELPQCSLCQRAVCAWGWAEGRQGKRQPLAWAPFSHLPFSLSRRGGDADSAPSSGVGSVWGARQKELLRRQHSLGLLRIQALFCPLCNKSPSADAFHPSDTVPPPKQSCKAGGGGGRTSRGGCCCPSSSGPPPLPPCCCCSKLPALPPLSPTA